MAVPTPGGSPQAPPRYSFDPYDENERFEVHQQSFVEDTLRRIGQQRQVASATVVDLTTGLIISTTLPVLADAALYATHVPPLVARATACAELADGPDSAADILLLCVSSRRKELLMVADRDRRWAVLVEQIR